MVTDVLGLPRANPQDANALTSMVQSFLNNVVMVTAGSSQAPDEIRSSVAGEGMEASALHHHRYGQPSVLCVAWKFTALLVEVVLWKSKQPDSIRGMQVSCLALYHICQRALVGISNGDML